MRAAYYLGMAVIHISEAEAARDFAGLLARVRAGTEVVIEGGVPIVLSRGGGGAVTYHERRHRDAARQLRRV